MEVTIYGKKDNWDQIKEEVKQDFQKLSTKEVVWNDVSPTSMKTSGAFGDSEVENLFNEYLTKYPSLDMYAKEIYDVREDDYSADWWGVTTIEKEPQKDGTYRIERHDQTYWN